jgi:predicted aldo/keto reductase-like oxidoreductase
MAFGTGTVLKGRDATDFVAQALESGFDHIDTAAGPFPSFHPTDSSLALTE